MKRVELDPGCFYRMRRGKLVEIPAEWLGQVVDEQTIRKRPSKRIHKLRKELSLARRGKSSNKKWRDRNVPDLADQVPVAQI